MVNDPSKLYPNTPERLKSLAGKLVSLEFSEGYGRIFYPTNGGPHTILNKFDVFVFLRGKMINEDQCCCWILHPEHGPLCKVFIAKYCNTWFKLAEET